MKKGFYILLIMCAAITIVSCGGKTKSYTDMLNDEKDAIESLIDKEGITLLSEFPSDTIFGDKEFFKLENGVYLSIIEQGKGDYPVLGSTVYLMRSRAQLLLKDSIWFDNLGPTSSGTQPSKFKYGYGYSEDGNPFVNEGLTSVLQYVKDSAYIRLIMPFKLMPSSYQSDGIGAYYEKVKLVYFK